MPCIKYEEIALRNDTLDDIEAANGIIEEYTADGYDLTLRQLYYQFVSRGIIANNLKSYNRLGDIVSKGRRAGLIDWDSIVDRTRNLQKSATWESPAAIVRIVAAQFRYDRWENQPSYVECWFEKDALMGVFERISNELRVPFFSCRGYTSDSEIWSAAQRLKEKHEEDGKDVVILHFGDHDPSGLDMTRDIRDRLNLFGAAGVDVRRLALNMEQVRRYRPPPNPAKLTDSRFAGYEKLHGRESWELDALDPRTLAALVRGEVESLIDDEQWAEDETREKDARTELQAISRNYKRVTEYLSAGGAP